MDFYERRIQEDGRIPRISREGELKGAVVYLASCHTLAVDGGMTV